jgi:hypothetical protein
MSQSTLPDQPDGIDEDSRDLPDPRRAAERVRAYICESGDGLYDVQGGAPLYARDLEALAREVLASVAEPENLPERAIVTLVSVGGAL